MSELVENPEDCFSHNETHFLFGVQNLFGGHNFRPFTEVVLENIKENERRCGKTGLRGF